MKPVANIALSDYVPPVNVVDVYFDPSDGRVTLSLKTGGAWVSIHLKPAERDALIAALRGAEFAPPAMAKPEPIPVAEATESGFGDLDGAEYPAFNVPGREFT